MEIFAKPSPGGSRTQNSSILDRCNHLPNARECECQAVDTARITPALSSGVFRKKVMHMIFFRFLYGISLSIVVFLSIFGFIHTQANGGNLTTRYVGDETCEVCHSSARIGKQFQLWRLSPHARAYKDLGSPEALVIARKMKISNPQKDLRCLTCHTTAPGAHLPEMISTFRKKDGVQCESCHGPGEDYSHFSTMIDPIRSKKAGLSIHPDEKTCKSCHNPSSPTFKGFDFKRGVARISHPIPDKYKKEFQGVEEGR